MRPGERAGSVRAACVGAACPGGPGEGPDREEGHQEHRRREAATPTQGAAAASRGWPLGPANPAPGSAAAAGGPAGRPGGEAPRVLLDGAAGSAGGGDGAGLDELAHRPARSP